jgi:hypothetical protein
MAGLKYRRHTKPPTIVSANESSGSEEVKGEEEEEVLVLVLVLSEL